MSEPSESVVLVEGYDDRDFWKGLLLHLGCTEARSGPPSPHRETAVFSYQGAARQLVHISPYKAPTPRRPQGMELSAAVRIKLDGRRTKPLSRLVIASDADLHPTLADARKSVHDLLLRECPDVSETAEGDFSIEGGSLLVSTSFLHGGAARDADGRLPPGVPEQPAMEQLVCAALREVYPDRLDAITRWLADRPSPTGKLHKAHAWSHYAGWFTDHGTGDFYSALWRDERVAEALLRLLKQQGALRIIESLVR
ncbi:MAG: hypothetical protein U0441_18595 [Polyangiaceae bacterium]